MMQKLPSPHDTFFGTMMEHIEVAQAFFKAHLPQALAEAIDWSTLQIYDSTRRLPGRKPLQTDITYHCLTKDSRDDVFLHVEQERNIDPTILARKLQYNAGLYLKYYKQGHHQLPIVASIVLYNGTDPRYPYHESFYEYFARPDLARLVMDQPFILLNLQKTSDEALATHGESSLMELFLKRAPSEDFPTWMRNHKALLRNLPIDRYFATNLEYVLQAGEYTSQELIDTFTEVYPHLKETVMTALTQLRESAIQEGVQKGMQKGIQEGMQQGIQEGMQQGLEAKSLEIARNMLIQLHLGIDLVQQATGLDTAALKRLQQEAKKA